MSHFAQPGPWYNRPRYFKEVIRKACDTSTRDLWIRGWKAKVFVVGLGFMVVVGTIITSLLVNYLVTPHLTIHPTEVLKPTMLQTFCMGTVDSAYVLTIAKAIRDSLFHGERAAGNIPKGLDTIVFRSYYVPSSGKGALFADIFLSCGCPEKEKKVRLIVARIFPSDSTYKIQTDLELPLGYYLNPFLPFLDQPDLFKQSETP